jgi:hypothetical protein
VKSQEVGASFLAMPNDEWEKRIDDWKKLTSGGKLMHELSQIVRQKPKDSTFDELRAHLDKWHTFMSKNEKGKRQWETARRILDLAKKSVEQPPMQDERFERTSFPQLEPWEWDAFCAFRGMPRSAERQVTLTALLIGDKKGSGFTAELTIERLPNGNGSIYPSPQEHAFLTLDEDFEGAIANAVSFVREQGFSFDAIDIRWRLERHDGLPLPYPLGGPSIGGAFAMGLMKLLGGGAQ